MGSDETAAATAGGPRVISVFDGDGRHRVQIIYFFWMQIGSRARSGLGLMVVSHLHRKRHRCGNRVLSESSGSKPLLKDG